jgi:hypothetical protein
VKQKSKRSKLVSEDQTLALVNLAKEIPPDRKEVTNKDQLALLALAEAVLDGEVTVNQATKALKKSTGRNNLQSAVQPLAYAVWKALREGRRKLVKV